MPTPVATGMSVSTPVATPTGARSRQVSTWAIRTAGTGTTSATTPLVAIGNQPCTGKNPPKYLNAEFNWLLIQDQAGQWVEATDGCSNYRFADRSGQGARMCRQYAGSHLVGT